MIVYQKAVRRNTPQLLRYTFKDQDGSIIPLTSYASVSLEAKREGTVYSTTTAAFQDTTNGVVQLASFTFNETGTWDIQFYCQDSSVPPNRLYGEIIQVKVVPNVDDLATDELAIF